VSAAAISLDSYLAGLRTDIELCLARVVAATTPSSVAEAMRYALLGAGKRLRPCLTLAVAETVAARVGLAAGHARKLAKPAAAAVEMIHSYSLVHDDLPAMDDDSMRRGRPTTHVVFGEGTAILAGDGLLTDAFAILATSPSPASDPGDPAIAPALRLRAVAVLAMAAGSQGMVGGQAIDLAAAGSTPPSRNTPMFGADVQISLDGPSLTDMHRRKTGALIRAATTMGGIVCGADEPTIAALDEYALELGLAFQIVDDVLDIEGTADALGKTAGKDAAAGKPTFPSLYGIEASKRMAADSISRAKTALSEAGLDGRLTQIADWSLARRQ
jgi:geranylgeranyl pyrophosphate synthase